MALFLSAQVILSRIPASFQFVNMVMITPEYSFLKGQSMPTLHYIYIYIFFLKKRKSNETTLSVYMRNHEQVLCETRSAVHMEQQLCYKLKRTGVSILRWD